MNEGIDASFFGHPAMTTPSFAQLALRLGLPVVPIRFERLHGTQFRVTVDPPLQITVTGDRATDVATLVQAVNDHIETRVRERPEQWFLVPRRWRENAAPVPTAVPHGRSRAVVLAELAGKSG